MKSHSIFIQTHQIPLIPVNNSIKSPNNSDSLIIFLSEFPPSVVFFKDAYLAAVVNEQGRQLQFGISDCDALALVARKVSQKARRVADAMGRGCGHVGTGFLNLCKFKGSKKKSKHTSQ